MTWALLHYSQQAGVTAPAIDSDGSSASIGSDKIPDEAPWESMAENGFRRIKRVDKGSCDVGSRSLSSDVLAEDDAWGRDTARPAI